jgi:hypothetical protein
MTDQKTGPLVSKIQEAFLPTTAGTLVRGYNVVFTVGAQGPFTLQIAADQFTAAEVNKRVQAFAAELAQIPMAGA